VAVAEGVFVPRPRSALLVREATALARRVDRPVVVDLCCGTGAIGAALAARVPGISLHATDLDPAAVRCAVVNLGARVHQGDLFEALPDEVRGRIAVLVANVPYVPTAEIPLLPAEARLHEPPISLDGGPDGLAVLRRVAAGAVEWLAPGGAVLMEIGATQVEAARRVLTGAGLRARIRRSEELDATVIIGHRPGPSCGQS
jgi:release factor glutamine methyltransferase